MKVDIHNQTSSWSWRARRTIRRVFRKVRDHQKMDLIFVDDQAIRRLNMTFRQIDRSTDVLSFPDDTPDCVSLGDVFISLETAAEQALTFGHSFEREVGFLAVHGYLHLKGYDHHTESDEALMIDAQERILKKAGLERIVKK